MPKRVSLPGVEEIFGAPPPGQPSSNGDHAPAAAPVPPSDAGPPPRARRAKRPAPQANASKRPPAPSERAPAARKPGRSGPTARDAALKPPPAGGATSRPRGPQPAGQSPHAQDVLDAEAAIERIRAALPRATTGNLYRLNDLLEEILSSERISPAMVARLEEALRAV